MNEGGDERGVLEPEAEPVRKDLEALIGVEGTELRGQRRWWWPEGLVELLLLWVGGRGWRRIENGRDGAGSRKRDRERRV